jgi:hypothetical protein
VCPVWGTNEAFQNPNFPIFALYTFTRSYTRTRDTITTSDCSDTVTSLLCVPIRIKLYPRVSAPVPPRATPIDSHSVTAKKGQRSDTTLMSSPSSSISCAWRIDVTVSSSQAKKVLRPTVLMTLSEKETFEMSLEMFQELRLTVAKMLTEMEWANEEVKRGGLGGR